MPTLITGTRVDLYAADTPERPRATVPNRPDHVTGDGMVVAIDTLGVGGAILINAFPMYRYDARYATEVQEAHRGRFALVKPDDSAVAETIADQGRAWAIISFEQAATPFPKTTQLTDSKWGC